LPNAFTAVATTAANYYPNPDLFVPTNTTRTAAYLAVAINTSELLLRTGQEAFCSVHIEAHNNHRHNEESSTEYRGDAARE
jgi:hypothetical protein